MANPEHVDWLKEGVEAWNERRRRIDFVPDFEGLDFRFGTARNLENRPDFSRINLSLANLKGADLGWCYFNNSNFDNCEMTGANAVLSRFQDCSFENAILTSVNFRVATLSDANMQNCNLDKANLGSAFLIGTDLKGASLNQTRIQTSDLYRADVRGVDLSWTTHLNRLYYARMRGDAETALPSRLKRPKAWQNPETTLSSVIPNATFAPITPVVDVFWDGDQLSGDFLLSAQDPTPQKFHPRIDPSAQMDLLASLAGSAQQIRTLLVSDDRENAQRLIGDATSLFRTIEGEVKSEGLVRSFMIDANLLAIEALCATNSEAFREVDAALIGGFLKIGQDWRGASSVLKEVTDPSNSELVPLDREDQIEEKVVELVAILTDEKHANIISPRLSGVTAEMAIYPWDKTDEALSKRKRLAAFGALAYRIELALKTPPSPALQNIGILATLIGLVAAIIALF